MAATGGLFACSGNDSDSAVWTWTNVIPDTFILRAHQDWNSVNSSGQELTRITVQATPAPIPSGSITASPNPVQVPSGSTATTVLSWSASNVTQIHITVSVNGAAESDVGTAGASGSLAVPWIQIGYQYVFRLRAETVSGTLLDSVSVASAPPTGNISASPNPVQVSGSAGTTVLTWNASNVNQIHVTVSINGAAETDVGTAGASGSLSVPWIGLGAQYVFRLRAETVNGTQLSSVSVTGTPPPVPQCTLSASAQSVNGAQQSNTSISIIIGEQSSLSASCNNSPASYNWSISASGPSVSGSSGSPSFWSTGSFSYSVQACNSSGCGQFSNQVTITVSPPAPYQASYVSQSVPTSMFAGRTYNASVTMQNNGGDTWSGGAGYALGSINPSGNTIWGLSRVSVPGSVSTNQQTTFNFSVTAPLVTSTYSFQWQMLNGNSTLFGSATPNVPISVQRPPTSHAGGSNLNFYNYPVDANGNLTDCSTTLCYYNYGIPFSYAKTGVRQTVQTMLSNMYAAGQRSLRVIIFFKHDATQNYDSNWQNLLDSAVDSSPKCNVTVSSGQSCPQANTYYLPVQYKQNLAQFLADIHAAGFERVLVAMGPEWINSFYDCAITNTSYADAQPLIDENWGVIQEVRSIVSGSGIPYLIDLGNEEIPPQGYFANGSCGQQIVEGTGSDPGYIRTIWSRYTTAYGAADSVGFSVIVGSSWDAQYRYGRIPSFLQPAPAAIDIHAYDDPTASGLSAAKSIEATLPAAYAVPWIIGETNQNNSSMASGFSSFANSSGKTILYLLQWPAYPTNCQTSSQCSPINFSNYSNLGF